MAFGLEAISIWWKVGIIFFLLIAQYFVLRIFFDFDELDVVKESFFEIEFQIVPLILTLVISAIFWAILWGTPWWATNYACGRWSCVNGPIMKVVLTVLLPIVGYPFAVRSWNK